jgi:uncharacterized protein (TIGR04255 family)
MVAKLPQRLKKAPVVEAVFELRFAPVKESAGDVLVGLLYSAFQNFQTIEPLPLSSIPREAREKDDHLRYLASHRLTGDGRHLIVGDRVVGLAYSPVYKGWTSFQGEIRELLAAVHETKLIQNPERISIKFVNIVPALPDKQLSILNARFEIANQMAPERGFRFRTEVASGEYITIIEIVTNTAANLPEGVRSGLLLNVDTLRTAAIQDIWKTPAEYLDQLHAIVRQVFFSLLTTEALNDLGPEWEEQKDDLH